ncbi:MAG: hypothetical protein P8H57_00745 [Emcibacteraceae bacterium]|nr:hypothetical protein [Emcibacteraceae bacterium]
MTSEDEVHESFNASLLQYGFVKKIICRVSHKKRLERFPGIDQSSIIGIPDFLISLRIIRSLLVFVLILMNFRNRISLLTVEVEHFLFLPFIALFRINVVFFSHSMPMRYELSSRNRLFLDKIRFLFFKNSIRFLTCIVHKKAALDAPFVKMFASRISRVEYLPHPVVKIKKQKKQVVENCDIRRIVFMGRPRPGKGFPEFDKLSGRCLESHFFHMADNFNDQSNNPNNIDRISNISSDLPLGECVNRRDVVFNAHDTNAYLLVPSGIFFDALSAGAWVMQYKHSNIDRDHLKYFRRVELDGNLELVRQKNQQFEAVVKDIYMVFEKGLRCG